MMRRFFLYSLFVGLKDSLYIALKRFLFVVLMGSLTSCEFETSDNGDLDGYWQLATIEDLQGNSLDVTQSRQFWSFQMRLLQLSDQRFVLPSYLFRFEHRGDSLRIYDPYVLDRTSADRLVTDASELIPYYIYELDQSLYIERLDADRMSLRSGSIHLHFNRY